MNSTETRAEKDLDRSGAQRYRDWTETVFPVNAMRICFDHYGQDLKGRIYSRMNEKEIPFRNCSEMLLVADALFDMQGYPQAFHEKRSFREGFQRHGKFRSPVLFLTEEKIIKKHGKIHTLDVVVQSRRGSGWQGVILDRDRRVIAPYGSELELLKIIVEELQHVSAERKSGQE